MRDSKRAYYGKRKTRTQIICDNLGVSNQTIFQDYKCTLKSGISYFGRLYIGQQHLMFASNMFGLVKKAAIVIDSITRAVQPTQDSIGITGRRHRDSVDQEFLFSGFKNDIPFKIIRALWKKQKLSSEVLNSPQDDQTENGEKSIKSLDEANVQISLFNPQVVQTQKQKMLEVILPCSVSQFYAFFLADNANVYSRRRHLQLKKATKIVLSQWRNNQEMNAQVRQVTALLKVKGVPFKSQANMNQVNLLTKNNEQEIVLKVITQMQDVPYCSYFNCQQHITVTKVGENKCKFECQTAVVFNKATAFKSTILTRTFADLQQDYKMWSDNVREILQKMQRIQQIQQLKSTRKSSGKSEEMKIEFELHNKLDSQKDIQTKKEKQETIVIKAELETLKNTLNGGTKLLKVLIALISLSLLLQFYQILSNNFRNSQQQSL